MAANKSFVDIDGGKVNSLINWKHNPMSTTDRVNLGGSLTEINIGLFVFDTDLLKPFYWSGSIWIDQEDFVQINTDWTVTDPTSVAYIRNKPIIPAAQIQSDWNETNNSLPDYIRNKPAIPAVQIQIDWNQTNTSSLDFIKNKPTIPSTYTLPIATTSVLGGVKPDGSSITIDGSGVIRATAISILTSMPKASTLGILANGTDQTAVINAALSNALYAGIDFDFSAPASVTVNGTVVGQGKTLRFAPGTTIAGTYIINNFMLDCGLRQKCFDIGTSGKPTGFINPIGTTLSVISPWVFGAKSDGNDIARPLQCTIDTCIRNGNSISKIIIPSGGYVCNSPMIEYLWGGSTYGFHQITIDGEANFAEASGYGSYINFANRKDSFAFGIQKGKGSMISNLKITGGFNYAFPGASTFYNLPYASMTDGVSRDTTYSPNAGIVVDPFGNTIPSDGGYPGNDAYGDPLSGYYRGSGNAGSTGCTFNQMFITNWVLGIVTSPNGQLQNAELIGGDGLQIVNTKICIAGSQDQEKLNAFTRLECWGVTYFVFASGLYGAGSPGNWYVQKANIAGYVRSLIWNNEQGYFPSYFSEFFVESLGTIGQMTSILGATFRDSTINFADYGEAGSYMSGQINGNGFTFEGCQLRMYGTNKPITIQGLNGPLYFRDCAFETVPYYNQDYGAGFCTFSNCTCGDIAHTINPVGIQNFFSYAGQAFSSSFAYGDIKLRIGNIGTLQRMYSIQSPVVGTNFPVTRGTGNQYVINTSVIGGITVATITCQADELNRILVGDVITYDASGSGNGVTILGIVTAIGSGTFTVSYIPVQLISGSSHYLNIWLPLNNISFIGDVTTGSNLITNVSIVDGYFPTFASGNAPNGLMITKSFKSTDTHFANMLRLMHWDGTSTLTVDRQSTYTATKVLFTNMDAEINPQVPTIAAGAAAGTSPTVLIVKGNDKSHQVSITTGTSAITGILATVSFLYGFSGGYIPSVKFSPANANAAAISGATQVYMDTTNTNSYLINSGSTPLANSTTYVWNIEVN